MNLGKKICMFLMTVATVVSVYAQSQQEPVTWSLRAKMISATEGEVIIKANIEPGWHLYGFNIPKGGPQATKIDLSGCKDIQFIDKLTMSTSPLSVKDESFGMMVTWWDSSVTFKRKFKVTGNAPTAEVQVTYMACDNMNCRPPKTEKLTKKITVR